MQTHHHVIRAAAFCTLMLATAASLGAAPSPGKIARETFTYGDRAITYYLYVPKSVGPTSRAPLIVLLHGSGRNGSSLVEPWKDLADKEGVILVGPDAVDTRRWAVPADRPEPLCALVDELRKLLPVDARRVYLFGHSAGAVFAIYMSVLEPGYFAAMAVHAGALRSNDEYRSLDAMTGTIPMFIIVGDRDQFFPVAAVTRTAEAFKAKGMAVKVDVIAGHDHNYYGMAAKVNRSVWEFLKPNVLGADPKYVPFLVR
jgi:poly(3-hydroxybutyrate) depolymerase